MGNLKASCLLENSLIILQMHLNVVLIWLRWEIFFFDFSFALLLSFTLWNLPTSPQTSVTSLVTPPFLTPDHPFQILKCFQKFTKHFWNIICFPNVAKIPNAKMLLHEVWKIFFGQIVRCQWILVFVIKPLGVFPCILSPASPPPRVWNLVGQIFWPSKGKCLQVWVAPKNERWGSLAIVPSRSPRIPNHLLGPCQRAVKSICQHGKEEENSSKYF